MKQISAERLADPQNQVYKPYKNGNMWSKTQTSQGKENSEGLHRAKQQELTLELFQGSGRNAETKTCLQAEKREKAQRLMTDGE